ncbi:hypothetical protein ATANTOWER_020338 [Ataeniobius toweri]|uniref:Uncharacterized protein n=1 Tax=Ataeniobius toweri TaxID=208326 RepID=A0ABU7C8L8_9TELE|nr:hypothetical protein [Ataeniobius toweri]
MLSLGRLPSQPSSGETSLDSMSLDLSHIPSFRAHTENPVRPAMNQTSANKQNKPPPGPDTFPDLNSTLNQGEADPVPESSCHNRNIVSAQNKTFQTKCCLMFLPVG